MTTFPNKLKKKRGSNKTAGANDTTCIYVFLIFPAQNYDRSFP